MENSKLTVCWVNPADNCRVGAITGTQNIGGVIVETFGFVRLAEPAKSGDIIQLPKGYVFKLERENKWCVVPK